MTNGPLQRVTAVTLGWFLISLSAHLVMALLGYGADSEQRRIDTKCKADCAMNDQPLFSVPENPKSFDAVPGLNNVEIQCTASKHKEVLSEQ